MIKVDYLFLGGTTIEGTKMKAGRRLLVLFVEVYIVVPIYAYLISLIHESRLKAPRSTLFASLNL